MEENIFTPHEMIEEVISESGKEGQGNTGAGVKEQRVQTDVAENGRKELGRENFWALMRP